MTTVRTTFPRDVERIDHVWIEMRDGTRLAGRIWRPRNAEQQPVPAVLEFLPYRKNDWTVVRDEIRHPYVAGHGYAAIRVDLRGSGDSEGVLADEYSEQELQDAEDVIAWLTQQRWCTGKVGMVGISWGGFNGLQVAARRPAGLAGVISACSTDDRYADDVHYLGGTVLASDMLPWASTMLAWNARPPDPAVVGERWRDDWLQRLAVTPWVEAWLGHQRRDDYWRHGSICEDYDAIECPVYMVGGWADPYRTAVLRFLENHRGPRKGLIGPWAHLFPEIGSPGPAIDFLAESVRFWDHCLKGADNGVLDGPMLTAYLNDTVEPAVSYDHRAGRWVQEESWPSPNVRTHELVLGDGTLGPRPSQPSAHVLRRDHRAGSEAGVYTAFGGEGDFAPDQRREDGLATCFDSEPLAEPLDALGTPHVTLTLTSDDPLGQVAVRLCELRTDGSSLLLTRGLLNLTHRDGHDDPRPLTPGEPTTVRIRLSSIGHRFEPGSRIRVAVTPTYWPWAWPTPRPTTLTLHADGSSLLALPVRGADAPELDEPPFDGAVLAPAPDVVALGGHPRGQRAHTDRAPGRHRIEHFGELGGAKRFPDGLVVDGGYRDVFTIDEHDPRTAMVTCERSVDMRRGDWHARVETNSTMSGTEDTFLVTNNVEAFEHGVRIFARTWDVAIPRDHG